MSTTHTAPGGAPASLDVTGTKAVPFARLTSVELRKMVDTRAGLWLMVVIVLLTGLFVTLLAIFGDNGATDERTFVNYLGATATPQGFLLPVMGILLVTSEWSQRTALVTFTLTPERVKVIAAKTVAALIIGLAAVLVAMGMAAAAAALAGPENAFEGVAASDFGSFGLLQAMGILQGLGFGLLFLNSAVAIVVFFVVPIAFNVLVTIVPWLQDAAPWIDISTAQTPLFGFDPNTGQDLEGGMTAEAWAQLASTSAIWIVLPIAVGIWRVLRSEAK